MVRQGKFKLELVRADSSSIPFQEHLHNTSNEMYAEVEPDTEYFVKFTTDDPRKLVVRLSIDGNKLGYTQNFHGGHHTKELGIWCFDHFKALKFDKLFRRSRNKAPKHSNGDEGFVHWTGNVEINVYERITLPGSHVQSVFEGNWQPNSEAILKGLDLSNNKKACNSIRGHSVTGKTSREAVFDNWREGSKLATMKLNYCSTVGLIAANILRPAPAPDISQIYSTVLNAGKANPKKRRRENDNVKVRTMTRIETYEVLDLTQD